ncbi:unnamed protein product [Rhizophagus irregularis]|nr:unnamed protein product [Rhizophagus irregularis]
MPQIYTLNDVDKQNKCMQNDLDHSHEENERLQNDLDHLHEENEKSSVSSTQKALSLKNSEITSFEARINELEAELEQIAQKALLEDTDTTQSLEIKVKELKNELKQVTVSNLEDELDQIVSHQTSYDPKIGSAEADSASLSNDYKHDEVVEEVPHFSSHYSEYEPEGKEDYDSISAVPIIALGVILIIWHICRKIFHPTKKEEIFYPDYRNKSYGFPIRYAKESKERTTTNETLPYGYG